MSQRGWRRLLPERSHLILLGGLAIAVIAALGFIELYNIRVEALAEHQAAAAQLQQLEEQNQMLQAAQAEGEQGNNIEPKARELFKLARPGEKKLVFQTPVPDTAKEEDSAPAPPARSDQPDWLDWLSRLLGR